MDTAVKKPQKHFKLKMPGAFTILFFLTIIAVLLTWIIPAGSYSKIQYSNNRIEMMLPDENKKSLPATQKTLDRLHVQINVEQFKSGAITSPVSVPNTYQKMKQHPAGFMDIFEGMVQGTMQAVDIMIFIFVLGGLIGVVRASGAFESGLMALTKKTKGHEFVLIFMVSVLLILGGTLCGIEEEAVAFYPILVPIFIAMGYDSIISIGSIFLASSIGTTFSTINPFSVVIASNAAGTTFTQGLAGQIIGLIVAAIFVISYLYLYAKKIKANPKASYTYEDHEAFTRCGGLNPAMSLTKPFL